MFFSNNLTVGALIRRILAVDLILSAIIATSNSLDLFIGGEAIGATTGATIGAAIAGWLLNFAWMSLVQGVIMAIFVVATCIALAVMFNSIDKEKLTVLFNVLRRASRIVFVLALLIAAYNGFFKFGLVSAAHVDPKLVVISTILTSLLTLVYGFFVLGFITLMATILFSVIAFVLSGGSNATKAEVQIDANNKPTE